MKIRKANMADKKEIQVLMDALNLYRNQIFHPSTQRFHERIAPFPLLEDEDFDNSLFFLAINDSEEVVGYIQGSIHTRKNHKLHTLGSVDELYVTEEFRSKGVAKDLFLELESECKQQGCDHLITHTDYENETSKQFYWQAGMHSTTIELWKEL